MQEYYEIDNQLSVFDRQYYLVVKSNDLVQQARYSLSAQAQKIILYLVSKIKPDDTNFKACEFDVIDFCKVVGIDCEDTTNRQYIDEAMDKILSQRFEIETKTHHVKGVWVNTVGLEKRSQRMAVKFNDELKPFLLQLKHDFFFYELAHVLALRSKYAIRLYEIFKSHSYQGSAQYTLEGLRKILDVTQYAEFKEFKRNVIDKALSEINEFTDLNIDYKTERVGRKIGEIVFSIKQKESEEERVAAMYARDKRLNGKVTIK